jgi:predicted methyltransferase
MCGTTTREHGKSVGQPPARARPGPDIGAYDPAPRVTAGNTAMPIRSPRRPLRAAGLAAALALGASLFAVPAWSDAAAPAAPADTATAAAAPAATIDAVAGLDAVLAHPRRSEANRKRDVHRHPAETLAFFGLRADATVVEIYPGGGWYTEILAPFLKASGRYYAATPFVAPGATGYFANAAKAYGERLAADPEAFSAVAVTSLSPPEHTAIAPAGSADLVLTFRNVHNWMSAKNAEGMFAAFFTALKPGGVLGLVEHRANPGTPVEQMIKSGYVTEQQVIDYATAAGFVLEARSEVNANPKDDKDHPAGVWTLPPVLRLGDVDRDVYTAIGESDRMTLKFRKPQ